MLAGSGNIARIQGSGILDMRLSGRQVAQQDWQT
jgi:hypothetical protein